MTNGQGWTSYKEQLRALSDRVVAAQGPIRILDALKWDDDFEREVVGSSFRRMPRVDDAYYRERRPLPFDPAQKHEEFAAIGREIASSIGATDELGAILARTCEDYREVVGMLQARGTAEFGRISRRLYGSAKDHFQDDRTSIRDLGLQLYEILTGIDDRLLGPPARALTAEQVVADLNERFGLYFGDRDVHAKLDDGILSDAAAGADYVKIRRGATLSERDRDILEIHEGWVHVGTTLNGRSQRVATWLSKGTPRVSIVQEGLAVILEVISFRMTPSRARKLNNRVLACDKAEDGASFLDVCAFYRTEGYTDAEAYQHAQRVFRGGVLEGGSPFTKDLAYCKGFVMVYNFLRTAIRFGRPDLIPYLFAGKVALEDTPALCRGHKQHVVDLPRYLPPQFADLNGLAMWMAYSNFFNRLDLAKIQEYYRARMTA